VFDRDAGGYRFAAPEGAARGERHELPGLWFNERELYALVMAHQVLGDIDEGGVIGRHIEPLLERIQHLLDDVPGASASRGGGAQALRDRVRLISPARRLVAGPTFERVGQALVDRRRVVMTYHSRSRGDTSEREVSPQRLVHYRGTWYLDAWCHQRERLLRFALDAIRTCTVAAARAREVALATVREQMDAGYGIFAGARRKWATLLVSADAARWIEHEVWHAEQRARWREDGRFELMLPYVDDDEVMRDVLRHGADIEVLAPAPLRERVAEALAKAVAVYRPGAAA
jgi:predicted DNA-binding transcriptional regulator YafY